jgi:tRNA A-37 threonylcarbamoyl transferase component Bud32
MSQERITGPLRGKRARLKIAKPADAAGGTPALPHVKPRKRNFGIGSVVGQPAGQGKPQVLSNPQLKRAVPPPVADKPAPAAKQRAPTAKQRTTTAKRRAAAARTGPAVRLRTRRSAPRAARIRWLGSRYRLRRVLGDGGMGTVYEAEDSMLKTRVAVKVLHPELGRDRDAITALKDEARTTMQLSHRYIVRLYDVRKTGTRYYLVMEYVDGETLYQFMQVHRRLPLETVLQLLAAAAEALDYAHRRGILHNDLKPANIMIDAEGVPKIIDFGVACAVDTAIHADYIMGTPDYMSPEQLAGDVLDARTDIYALATICYELLSGCDAFPDDVDKANAAKHTPPRLEGFPDALADVLQRAMAHDRTQRYPDIVSFSEAFLSAAS